jgi:hypothetical protein
LHEYILEPKPIWIFDKCCIYKTFYVIYGRDEQQIIGDYKEGKKKRKKKEPKKERRQKGKLWGSNKKTGGGRTQPEREIKILDF